MATFYLDCEFDGFGGDLLSLALIREDNESIYIIYKDKAKDPWVKENVIPILRDLPPTIPGAVFDFPRKQFHNHYSYDLKDAPSILAKFLTHGYDGKYTGVPYIITDWPDDIRYLCSALITGPGTMASLPRLLFDMVRVNAYPTSLSGAVQHNSWHDARALKYHIEGKNNV